METFELLWTAGADVKLRLLVLAAVAQMLLAIRLYGVMSGKRMKAAKEGRSSTETYRATQSEPEDLAGPLLFLSSKASDFYTGHILYADGGYTAG